MKPSFIVCRNSDPVGPESTQQGRLSWEEDGWLDSKGSAAHWEAVPGVPPLPFGTLERPFVLGHKEARCRAYGLPTPGAGRAFPSGGWLGHKPSPQ